MTVIQNPSGDGIISSYNGEQKKFLSFGMGGHHQQLIVIQHIKYLEKIQDQ